MQSTPVPAQLDSFAGRIKVRLDFRGFPPTGVSAPRSARSARSPGDRLPSLRPAPGLSIRPSAPRKRPTRDRRPGGSSTAGSRRASSSSADAGVEDLGHGPCALPSSDLPPVYVRQSEDLLCEPVLYVELLTVSPCGEEDGKGIVKSSLFPRGLRSWRMQSAGPAVAWPTPALTAARAPRPSWPRPSIPSSAAGGRSSLAQSRPRPPGPPLNTDFSNNLVHHIRHSERQISA